MSWIDEIGEKELSDKHIKIFVNLISLAAEDEEGTSEESVKAELVNICDIALKNINKIKAEALK